MNPKSKTLREIIVFLVLTVILSSLAYIPIIQAGTINGGQSQLAGLLMLAPGLAAVITYLVFERSLRPIGWRPGKIQYLLLGLVIPVIYCLIAYGLVWLTGRGKYNGQFPANFPIFLVTMLFNGTLSAVLEEVAWRGFLVPKMMELTSFTKTAMITGLIWAVWHYPLIIFSKVRLGNTPLPYSLACFTIFAVGISFATAWLRMKSGSVWTAALLHGSHNVFMLHVFNTLTSDTGGTWLLLGEYGAVIAAMGVLLGILFWSLRARITSTSFAYSQTIPSSSKARSVFMNTSITSAQSTSASRNLQQVMRQHPLFFFFLMAYAFTWIFLIPQILSVWGILKGDFTIITILSIFVGPFLAAIIMTRITEGNAGVLRLRQRIKQWRFGWQWYLIILVGIPTLILLGIIIQPGTLASFQGLTPRLLVSYPVYFVIVFFGVGAPEEIGWRGFALPRMQPRYGPLWGTLILGVLWVFWHLPRFLLPEHGGGPGTGWVNFFTNFSYFFLMVVALAIILTWVFNHTRGSIFAAILVHTALDTPTLVWTPLFLTVNETRFLLATVIAFGVPALLIVILTRGRLGYQPSQEQPLGSGEREAQPTL